MKKTVVILGLLVLLSMTAIAKNLESGKSDVVQLYLYEKQPYGDWLVVEDGMWGKMTYNMGNDKFVFNGHGLEMDEMYSLVSYGGWPNVWVLGEGMADMYGDVNIKGMVGCDELLDEDGDQKIWLVKSGDVVSEEMIAWNPTMYLFENNLLTCPEVIE